MFGYQETVQAGTLKRISRISFITALVGALVTLSTNAGAIDFIRWGSQTWDHARLLPAGQTVLELRGQAQRPSSLSTGSSRADATELKSLGFKQTLRNVLESADNSEERLEAAKASGVNLNQVVAEAELEVERMYSETQVRWSHSLTGWWMLGLVVPYVQSTTRVRVKTSSSEPNLPMGFQVQEDSPSSKFSIQEFRQMISDRNWDQLSEEMTYNGLGNLELLSQLRLHEGRDTYLSFRNRVLIPGGTNETAYQPIPMGPEDGQLSLGSDVLADWSPSARVLLTGIIGYTLRIQDQVAARVPNESQSRWFWQIDPNVDRNLGDVILARINSSIKIYKQYWLTAGFEQFEKLQDQYSGSQFTSEQYQRMQEGTSFSRRLVRIGLRFQPPLARYVQQGSRQYAGGIEYLTTLPTATQPQTQGASFDMQVFF